ncbi:hypothetical protein CYCME_2513 [Cycloclasticus zancles 78-ME]|uniref:Uncharacterized protein n=1 Tax=Cycloclasticus zancles 78-ME TaxID=1198232 RepID=S5T4M9_9GAMM|nr:hypothetical protein CYCME_0207 [Cycloclasticus zancles 78-ME]AGS40818.1 hypothetical protein CYCME_2513 [Cycloclasticus zancles 78-ME]
MPCAIAFSSNHSISAWLTLLGMINQKPGHTSHPYCSRKCCWCYIPTPSQHYSLTFALTGEKKHALAFIV